MKKIAIAVVLAGLIAPLSADQVIADDLVVQSSLCVGMDCVNGESFGFDTIRLKENNLRIKFEDTSTGTFPSNDWQITANDSASGGLNKFSIDDITGGRTPFTIEAGAKSNSLYVDDYGRVGFGTSIPVTQLHSVNNNTPTLRLEQDGSGGWTPQSWDIAGNEANFFIRDVTNGSRLPFRIQPGAPTNALTLRSDGKVGIGTWAPDAALHVTRSDGTAKLLVEETGAQNPRILYTLKNNGDPYLTLENTSATYTWMMGTNLDAYVITTWGNGATKQFRFAQNGDLTITGAYNQSSDKNLKENIQAVGTDNILAKINTLPLYQWNYISSTNDIKHYGAMAQDFYKSFSLGEDDKHIAPLDAAFIAMAGVQELKKELDQKNAQIEALRKELDELKALQARMIHIEQMVERVSRLGDNNGLGAKVSSIK